MDSNGQRTQKQQAQAEFVGGLMTRATCVLFRIFFVFSIAVIATTQALAQYGSSLQGVITNNRRRSCRSEGYRD